MAHLGWCVANYGTRVAFSDGTEDVVGLSDLSVQGILKAWNDERFLASSLVPAGRFGGARRSNCVRRPFIFG